MKTLKLGGTYVRAEEQSVKAYLDRGYKYCAKSEWKQNDRDLKKAEREAAAAEKAAQKAAEKAEKAEKQDKKQDKKRK